MIRYSRRGNLVVALAFVLVAGLGCASDPQRERGASAGPRPGEQAAAPSATSSEAASAATAAPAEKLDGPEWSGANATALPAAEKWGIQPLAAHATSAGHMIDVRYRVTDAQRAGAFMEKVATAELVQPQRERRLTVSRSQRTGPLRQKPANPEAGHVYYVMFSNPNREVQAGERVTLALDGEELARITVD